MIRRYLWNASRLLVLLYSSTTASDRWFEEEKICLVHDPSRIRIIISIVCIVCYACPYHLAIILMDQLHILQKIVNGHYSFNQPNILMGLMLAQRRNSSYRENTRYGRTLWWSRRPHAFRAANILWATGYLVIISAFYISHCVLLLQFVNHDEWVVSATW